jgi:hypothetical protein
MPTFHLTYTDNKPLDYSIKQGVTYRVPFNYYGDVSTWTSHGQIRRKWLYQDPDCPPLVSFSFPVVTYDSTTSKTLIIAELTPTQTASLPPTNNRQLSSSSINLGVNVYVYDIFLTSPLGVVIELSSGYIEVNPRVTQV